MDLSTAVTLVQLFKQVVQEFIKHNNFVAVFTEAGKRMVELEADRNSDVSEKIKILFSKENMERLAKDCENLNGYELLDYVNDFLREFFNSEDLKYIDIERVIKVFNNVFINNLKNNCSDLYDQYYSKAFRDENSKEHKLFLDKLDYLIELQNDMFQYGSSFFDIENELKFKTIPYKLDLDFFDYDNKEIDEELIDQLKNSEVIQIQFSSKEEGLYYILRLLKFNFPEKVKDVLVVRDEADWRRLKKIEKDLILIPLFYADTINPISGKQTIIIFGRGDFDIKAQAIKVPNRLRSNLYFKLDSYVQNAEKTQQIIEQTSGAYLPLMRTLTGPNSYSRAPKWLNENSDILVAAALVGAWTTREADKSIVAEIAGMSYDNYYDEIKSYYEKDDPFLVSYNSFSGIKNKVVDVEEAIACLKSRFTRENLEFFLDCVKKIMVVPHSFVDGMGIVNENNKYSLFLKKGISKTLIVMSLTECKYGDGVNDNFKCFVNDAVLELMRLVTTRERWYAISDLMPMLIEAAPNIVLEKIETCIRENDESFWSLFEQKKYLFSCNSAYVSILDALSVALFLKDVSVRALQLLETIAEKDINYNSGNTPIALLSNYFCVWFYEIDIEPDNKIKLLNYYSNKYPKSCWLVLKTLLPTALGGVYEPLRKPMYTSYALFSGDLTDGTVINTIKEYFLIAFKCAGKDLSRWMEIFKNGMFIEYGFRDDVIESIYQLVQNGALNDREKYEIEKTIRSFLYNHRLLKENSRFKETDLQYIEENLLRKITYSNETYKILYAFDRVMLDIHPCSLEEDKEDHYLKNINKKNEKQKELLKSSYNLKEVILLADDSYDLGSNVNEICFNGGFDYDFAYFLYENRKLEGLKGYLFKALGLASNEQYFIILKQIIERNVEINFIFRVLESHKIDDGFLKELQNLDKPLQDYYWENTTNLWFDEKYFTEVDDYVVKMVSHGNFHNPFLLVWRYEFDLNTYFQMLKEVVHFNDKKVEEYNVLKVFEKIYELEILDETLIDTIIQLEMCFVHVFNNNYDNKKPKYLLKRLQEDPSFVANLLLNMYPKKHNDMGEFTAEEKNKADFYRDVFLYLHFCPSEDHGQVDAEELDKWCETFLNIMRQNDLYDIGIKYLGEFLAHSPSSGGGTVWPVPSVCQAIEKYYTEKLGNSFLVETLNMKNVHLLNAGKSKKKTAEHFETYLQESEFQYPCTAKILHDIRDAYLEESKFERSCAEYEYQ